MVEAFAAWCLLDVGELGRAVLEHDTRLQALEHLVIHFPTYAHGVFAVHFVRRVHQAVGQLTVSGEQQQTGGVDVQTADVDPTTFLGAWQAIKHGRATFRVVAGADLAIGLVVHDHPARRLGRLFTLDQLAVHSNGVMQVDALAKGGCYAVDLDAALADPGLNVTARAHANARENFLQLLANRWGDLGILQVLLTHLGTSRCRNENRFLATNAPKGRASYVVRRMNAWEGRSFYTPCQDFLPGGPWSTARPLATADGVAAFRPARSAPPPAMLRHQGRAGARRRNRS